MNRLIETIRQLCREKDRVIIAIDGCCAGGKTTLSARLKAEFDCNVLPMDDFFLQPHQRTPDRFAEPGGNVDYERFYQEVLQPLLRGADFSYRPYDCSRQALAEPVAVKQKKLTIVEGTYSHHPSFGDVYDLRVFLRVSPELQRKRILERPEFLHERFFTQWIPMEKLYFETFSVAEKSDLILEGEA